MSKGYLAIVQNSKHDYLRMAYALALSIASSQKSVRKMSIAIDKNVIIIAIVIPIIPRRLPCLDVSGDERPLNAKMNNIPEIK